MVEFEQLMLHVNDTLVACTTHSECEQVLHGALCWFVALEDGNQTDLCVCNPDFGRAGADCSESTELSLGFGVLFIITWVICFSILLHSFRVLHSLRPSIHTPAGKSALIGFTSEIFVVVWGLCLALERLMTNHLSTLLILKTFTKTCAKIASFTAIVMIARAWLQIVVSVKPRVKPYAKRVELIASVLLGMVMAYILGIVIMRAYDYLVYITLPLGFCFIIGLYTVASHLILELGASSMRSSERTSSDRIHRQVADHMKQVTELVTQARRDSLEEGDKVADNSIIRRRSSGGSSASRSNKYGKQIQAIHATTIRVCLILFVMSIALTVLSLSIYIRLTLATPFLLNVSKAVHILTCSLLCQESVLFVARTKRSSRQRSGRGKRKSRVYSVDMNSDALNTRASELTVDDQLVGIILENTEEMVQPDNVEMPNQGDSGGKTGSRVGSGNVASVAVVDKVVEFNSN